MSHEQLRDTLTNLHNTLSDTSDVDDETRALLLRIMTDIQRLLAGEEPESEPDDSLTEQISEMAREFDANHPVLGGLLHRLSDGLANLGI